MNPNSEIKVTLEIFPIRDRWWNPPFKLLLKFSCRGVHDWGEGTTANFLVTGVVPKLADPKLADFRPSTQVGRFFRNSGFFGENWQFLRSNILFSHVKLMIKFYKRFVKAKNVPKL